MDTEGRLKREGGTLLRERGARGGEGTVAPPKLWTLGRSLCVVGALLIPHSLALSQTDLEISTGETHTLPDKGFSIAPPKGWEIHRGVVGVTLLLREPRSRNEVYRPNIQVLSFPEPKFIDDLTLKEFGATIVEKFQKHARGIENFNLRDSMMIQLKDKSDAILYYTEFEANERQMMQAHLLLSSQDTHFLVTFSDVKETFEDPQKSDELKKAWDALISVELNTPSPKRINLKLLAFLLLSLILLGTLFLFFRRRANRNHIPELDADIVEEDEKDKWNLP